jgi:beta-keto acid cleavage enzyme
LTFVREERVAARKPANKVIITCAVTGSIHTPTMSEALPITPGEIAEQAVAAAEAGAAILHLHARDPKDGRPSPILPCSCSADWLSEDAQRLLAYYASA